jgi:imidazolonepropionase-like amidohydrolase
MAATAMPLRTLLTLTCLLSANGQVPPHRNQEARKLPPVAFINVTVVPMDREHVLKHQTVLIRDGRIAEIGLAERVHIPAGTVRIDGRRKYLMPGLADMHVHPEDDQLELALFIANGVTMIRTMHGTPDQLRWRSQTATGKLIGPTMYVSGPLLDGLPPLYSDVRPIATSADGRRAVREQHAAGYDCIKVYNSVSTDAYEAIIAEARLLRLPVAGHVPFSAGLRGALAARQASIEHLRGYAAEMVPAHVRPGTDLRSRSLSWNDVDESRFALLARETREAGVWNCPTLYWSRSVLLPRDAFARWRARPQMRYARPAARRDTRAQGFMKNFSDADYREAQRGLAVQQRFVKALHDAGARLLLGTDTGSGGSGDPAGFAVHDELRLLVEAGLSPYEALKAGTRDAAEFVGQLGEWGTVTAGRRADLLLVEGNPLTDTANVRRRVGVMLRGRWLPNTELRKLLHQVAATRQSP